jgi:hypothetical protein
MQNLTLPLQRSLLPYSGWGSMHSNSPSYIRMALTLVDKVLKCRFKQPLPVPASASRSSKRPRSDSPLFPGAVCTKTDTPARTTSPASLLVVHVAASPALVATNQTSPTPREDTPSTAPESPDPDTTSAAPAPVSAAATAAVINACRTYLFACHFQPFLVIFFILQKSSLLLYCK